ncbi:hypothetical protein [Pseudomonas sp. EL_65y_Pfl1_R83]|uniref:hypothetical protein n=1 Tax=Pseudomonas sp. EL_65y_Pfl1_R83 TaxID=3088697 RepID=UPI0030D71C9E
MSAVSPSARRRGGDPKELTSAADQVQQSVQQDQGEFDCEHVVSLPRWAAEGGLGFGDLFQAALSMGFVVGVDATVLPVTDARCLQIRELPKSPYFTASNLVQRWPNGLQIRALADITMTFQSFV